ncbi:MAG TPA: hypothetical protein VFA18_09875 [Gemmataceae bacterium]|nr:hypothetical protein [Gemmataceae bacterium]
MNSRRKAVVVDLLIAAMEKLPVANQERRNVVAFVESCYGGLVRRYDFEAALASLAKLTDEEQHVLIEHLLRLPGQSH